MPAHIAHNRFEQWKDNVDRQNWPMHISKMANYNLVVDLHKERNPDMELFFG